MKTILLLLLLCAAQCAAQSDADPITGLIFARRTDADFEKQDVNLTHDSILKLAGAIFIGTMVGIGIAVGGSLVIILFDRDKHSTKKTYAQRD